MIIFIFYKKSGILKIGGSMKKQLPKATYKILLLIAILLIFILVLWFYVETSDSKKQINIQKKIEETTNYIKTLETSSTLIEENKMESLIQLVFQEETGEYKSYYINVSNGEQSKLEEFLKSGQQENFLNKIHESVELKYPKFISEVLCYGNGDVTYVLKENEMTVYFYHFEIYPSVSEELSVTLNYNEIKDDLDIYVTGTENYEKENGYTLNKEQKAIALTFDDGPSGQKTLDLLNIFADNKMHATFFMVGNRMAAQPHILKEVLKSGNEIGGHSYNHANLNRQTKDFLIKDQENLNTVYQSITGETLKLLRPPYGNANSLVKETLNYSLINWNIDTEDWRYKDSERIYNEILNKVEDGDIILMHDLYDTTIEAVRKLLPELYSRGFQVVTISELAELKGKTLEPHIIYRSIK